MFVLPSNLAEVVMQYLGTRPYAEVHQVAAAFRSGRIVDESVIVDGEAIAASRAEAEAEKAAT